MTRLWAKYALYALACVALIDFARFRHRQGETGHKDAIHTWEGEGGALPE
jgi:hypothetical protein